MCVHTAFRCFDRIEERKGSIYCPAEYPTSVRCNADLHWLVAVRVKLHRGYDEMKFVRALPLAARLKATAGVLQKFDSADWSKRETNRLKQGYNVSLVVKRTTKQYLCNLKNDNPKQTWVRLLA